MATTMLPVPLSYLLIEHKDEEVITPFSATLHTIPITVTGVMERLVAYEIGTDEWPTRETAKHADVLVDPLELRWREIKAAKTGPSRWARQRTNPLSDEAKQVVEERSLKRVAESKRQVEAQRIAARAADRTRVEAAAAARRAESAGDVASLPQPALPSQPVDPPKLTIVPAPADSQEPRKNAQNPAPFPTVFREPEVQSGLAKRPRVYKGPPCSRCSKPLRADNKSGVCKACQHKCPTCGAPKSEGAKFCRKHRNFRGEQKKRPPSMSADGKTKRCSACRQVLPVEKFGKNNSKGDGLQIYCRDCRNPATRYDGNLAEKMAELAARVDQVEAVNRELRSELASLMRIRTKIAKALA